MAPIYQLVVDAGKLKVLIEKMHLPANASTSLALGRLIRDAAEMVRTRAVWNVSGYPVVFEGGVFRVMVRTGALKGSMEVQWPFQTALRARVFVNGTMTATAAQQVGGFIVKAVAVSQYAGSIEWGHKEIDLKKTMLGKTVPFFASRTQNTRGPYSVRGLQAVTPGEDQNGSMFHNVQLNAKLAAQGHGPMAFQRKAGGTSTYASKGGGSYYIAFRKVGKTGWIIPEAKPRPFLKAALVNTQDNVRRQMVRGVVNILRP